MNPNESETQETWRVIAQRSSDIAQRLYQAMLEFCKTKRKGRKRCAEMSLIRRAPLAIDALEEGLKVVVKI